MGKHRRAVITVAVLVLTTTAWGCGRSEDGAGVSEPQTAAESIDLKATTPPATGKAGTVVWAVYRPVQTLDPIQAFDYPDDTAVSAMCEAVMRQRPDGTLTSGLATMERPDRKTVVLQVRPDATFWDGKPVTAEDVAWSLQRNLDPSLGSLFAAGFNRVASIAATGPKTVTIKLTKPDYWLEGELSQMAGVVMQKAFSESLGSKLGTPASGIMCTGAYKLQAWNGEVLTAVANPRYWGEEPAKAAKIELRGVSDEATLTSGLQTGEIDGTYALALSTIDQLRNSSEVNVFEGPSYGSDALVISNLDGALKDVRVRRALSMAIDRKALITQLYKGTALMPRTLANPGSWGYGREVFEADWNKQPEPTLDVAEGKRLVEAAGAEGETIVIGMSNEINALAIMANALRSAAESIGLKVKLKSVPAAQYVNFFIDPKAREGVDGFPTSNYPSYADPANFYLTFALPGATQNYSGFSDPQITSDLEKARETADPDARAELVAAAGDRIMELLPWVPYALPKVVLPLNQELTGAPSSFTYMFAPWANGIGTTG